MGLVKPYHPLCEPSLVLVAPGAVSLAFCQTICYPIFGVAQRQAVSHTSRKGVRPMRITLHIGAFTVTIIVKRRNRHPGR